MSHTSSSKPSKQRKAVYTAPLNKLRKMFSSHLSEDLRKKYTRRAFPLCKGDSVKILRGDFAGLEGKISDIDKKSKKILIEGVTREKVAGQTIKIPVHPSNVILTTIRLDDKRRSQALERSKKREK